MGEELLIDKVRTSIRARYNNLETEEQVDLFIDNMTNVDLLYEISMVLQQ